MLLPNLSGFNVVLFMVYGLVFIIMGMAIMIQRNKSSDMLISKNVHYLAAFGILHGVVEWLYIYIPLQLHLVPSTQLVPLLCILFLLKIASYVFLFYFGAYLYLDTRKRLFWAQYYCPIAIGIWIGICVWSISFDPFALYGWTLAEVWSRYLLALPASLITGYALMLQLPEFEAKGMPNNIKRNLFLLAHVMFCYAIFGGLIVPPADFFPASVLNTKLFREGLHIPIQVFRSVCGLLMAVLTIRVLAFYDLETRKKVDEAERKHAIYEERERIARDLHDGIIQSIYGEGLRLEHFLSQLKEEEGEQKKEITKIINRLNGTIEDIRHYISELKLPNNHSDLEKVIRNITQEVTQPNLQITLEVGAKLPILHSDVIHNVVLIFREAFHNAIRHAEAENITIILDNRRNGLYLAVLDDGVGFTHSTSNGHHGVINMKKRAESIMGALSINGYPGFGTEVVLIVPCNVGGGVKCQSKL